MFEFTERLDNIKEVHTTVETFLEYVLTCKSQFESSAVKNEELTKTVFWRMANVQLLIQVKALYYMSLCWQQL